MGNEVVGGDLGRLKSIPSTGLVQETRRISWWCWIDEGTTGVVGRRRGGARWFFSSAWLAEKDERGRRRKTWERGKRGAVKDIKQEKGAASHGEDGAVGGGPPRAHAARVKGEDDSEGDGVSLAKRYQWRWAERMSWAAGGEGRKTRLGQRREMPRGERWPGGGGRGFCFYKNCFLLSFFKTVLKFDLKPAQIKFEF
jgi:hypothetical protein